MRVILKYDGSFDGFLSCVFEVFNRKLKDVSIEPNHKPATSLFDVYEQVDTEIDKSQRVWNALKRKCPKGGARQLLKAYLSELDGVEQIMLGYVKAVFRGPARMEKDFSNPYVLKIAKIAKMVSREKHRMDAFIRFKRTDDDLYTAVVAPDFNVLPLNKSHFERRYADQRWLIYDEKRHYGIYYDLNKVSTVELSSGENSGESESDPVLLESTEHAYEDLWRNYFNATNITERKNMSLHIRHVPLRYWKYLSEKKES